ncbi:hypothetical protein PSECIP111854_03038 [Pseudoalteromonas sp. CIP111854]|uniref:Uncharacterized protein n=1 Tax=Pseudoalteromonas holothuriae TaxID=2963714 RepID=A0A9W4VTB8_9GAMM|nr:hypothetical protein PSECIP111854_03038 [Pseudoalteromonas sp. CIP111854]
MMCSCFCLLPFVLLPLLTQLMQISLEGKTSIRYFHLEVTLLGMRKQNEIMEP